MFKSYLPKEEFVHDMEGVTRDVHLKERMQASKLENHISDIPGNKMSR